MPDINGLEFQFVHGVWVATIAFVERFPIGILLDGDETGFDSPAQVEAVRRFLADAGPVLAMLNAKMPTPGYRPIRVMPDRDGRLGVQFMHWLRRDRRFVREGDEQSSEPVRIDETATLTDLRDRPRPAGVYRYVAIKRKWTVDLAIALAGLVAAAFGASWLWLFPNLSAAKGYGWMFLIGGLLFFAAGGVALLNRRPQLSVGDDGFFDGAFHLGWVDWRDVAGLRVVREESGPSLYVRLRDRRHAEVLNDDPTAARVRPKDADPDETVLPINMCDIDPDALLDLMQTCWRRKTGGSVG